MVSTHCATPLAGLSIEINVWLPRQLDNIHCILRFHDIVKEDIVSGYTLLNAQSLSVILLCVFLGFSRK